MGKFNWKNGSLIEKAKVIVNGETYEVEPAQYEGETPLTAGNLNEMQNGIYKDMLQYDQQNNKLVNDEKKVIDPNIPRYSYKVGDLFLTTNTENPADRFGGTWELIAKGCTLVGVDEDDEDFNEVMKTGGEKTHKLTRAEVGIQNVGSTSSGSYQSNEVYRDNYVQAHNIVQPYFTCYFWRKSKD